MGSAKYPVRVLPVASPKITYPKNIFEFTERFPTEDACRQYLVENRWPDGFECPDCGSTEDPYYLPKRGLFECRECRYQVSPTAGTVMEGTRTPLRKWFWGAYLASTVTPGISAVQFQRQAGIPRYETAYMMLHKLRAATVREDRDKLKGEVEVDEAFLGGQKTKDKGRYGAKKAVVISAVEVNKDGTAGRVRMRKIPSTDRRSITRFIKDSVEPGAHIVSDGHKSYGHLPGYKHVSVVADQQPDLKGNALPHVHRVFSNLKSWLIGTHHGVSHEHLQAYLNEYTFRFNRRRYPMSAFKSMLGLADERLGPTYDSLPKIRKHAHGQYVHPNPDPDPVLLPPQPRYSGRRYRGY